MARPKAFPMYYIIKEPATKARKKETNWRVDAVLGEGERAHVYLVTDTETKLKLACKVINKALLVSDKMKLAVANELRIHAKLKHDNIV